MYACRPCIYTTGCGDAEPCARCIRPCRRYSALRDSRTRVHKHTAGPSPGTPCEIAVHPSSAMLMLRHRNKCSCSERDGRSLPSAHLPPTYMPPTDSNLNAAEMGCTALHGVRSLAHVRAAPHCYLAAAPVSTAVVS